MDLSLLREMASVEDSHWWFVARRAIIEKLLSTLPQSGYTEILEVGCGTGGNLAMLARYGHIYGMEPDETARAFASAKQIAEIAPGSLPDDIPFKDTVFDIIAILDVLEHIENDVDALRALHSRLAHAGWLLVTVPALNSLWSKHDEIHHHKRRYTVRRLQNIVSEAGFSIVYASYFNTILFPFMAAGRVLQRLLGQRFPDGRVEPRRGINRLFTRLFSLERFLVGNVYLPFGGSIILLGRKL